MNIWQEVEKRFPALQPDDEELTIKLFELRSFRRSAFHSGAEWARREALREAEAAVDRCAPEMGRDINITQYRDGLNDGVMRSSRAVRALAGGDAGDS